MPAKSLSLVLCAVLGTAGAAGCGAAHTVHEAGDGSGEGGDGGSPHGGGSPGDPGADAGGGPGEPVPEPAATGWTRTFAGDGGVDVRDVASGPEGLSAVVGSFGGEIDLDPGEGVDRRRGEEWESAFILVLDATGERLWAGTITARYVAVTDVAFTPDGAAVVRGYFLGVADFDIGDEVFELESDIDTASLFVAEYDRRGQLVWVVPGGADAHEDPCHREARSCSGGLAVGDDGSVYFGSSLWPHVAKLDPDGGLEWERFFDGAFNRQTRGVAVASDGSVRVTGTFQPAIDLDPGPGTDHREGRHYENSFVVSLDSDGGYLWGRTIGGDVHDISVGVGDATVLAGSFINDIDLDPGPDEDLRSPVGAWWNSFVVALDARGDYLWAGTFGGGHGAQLQALSATAGGDVLLSGSFYETVDFDPGPGVVEATASPMSDIFLLRLGAGGGFRWLRTYGTAASESDSAPAVAGTFDGCAMMVGRFTGAVDFRPGPAEDEHGASPGDNAYVTRLLPEGLYER